VLYYRLLKYDVAKAEAVVRCPKVSVNSFVDPGEEDLTDKIFDEFNTLSVIYKKPAELFITDEGIEDSDDDKDDYDEDENADEEEEVDEDDDDGDEDEVGGEADNVRRDAEPVSAPANDVMGDMLGFGGGAQ